MTQIENFAFTVNLLLDQLGAFLFIALIYVSIKYKKLHCGHCMKMMVIYFLCCLGSKFLIILPYLIKVVPLPNVPLYVCVFVQIIPFSMTSMLTPLTMTVALDRWLSVFYPIWYNQKRNILYLPILLAIAATYPIYSATFIFENLMENFYIPTNCTWGNLFGNKQLNIDWNLAFNVITILCYFFIFGKLLWDGREGRKEYFHRQPIFKSLFLIIAIQTFGWLITLLAYRYFIALVSGNMTEEQIPLLYYCVNYFSSLCSTIEMPALYFSSSEHRLALKKEFGWFFRLFKRQKTNPPSNSIGPKPAIFVANSQTKMQPPNSKMLITKISTPKIFTA